MIETVASDIAWTEPRDVTVQELFPPDEDLIGPQFASKHNGIVQVAFADGHAQRIRTDQAQTVEWRKHLFGVVTADGGRPYGGRWLPGEEPVDDVGEFPPEVEAEKLSTTDVVAHLHGRTAPRRNAVWCAPVQIAWDELRRQINAAPQVRDCEIADGLNKTPFPLGSLDPAAYVARLGTVDRGIKEQIATEMKRKFPDVTVNLNPTTVPTDFILYAFLQKNLPFKVRFDRLREPLTFHGADGDINVKSFGFKKLKEAKGSAEKLHEQVSVLHYRSDDEFVIRLNTKSDEIVLAKVAPSATLAETLADVTKRIAAGTSRPTPEDDETLIVPALAFNILRSYHELKDKVIENYTRGGDPHQIREARQSVRFLLNERGARIESGVELVGPLLNGHDPPPPPRPRRFVLDKPFLLYVKEVSGEAPYLVLWVANGELMERFAGR